eukprot:340049_1
MASWFKIDYLRQDRLWWRFGCVSAAFAVAMGALGAHFVSRGNDKTYEQTFKTARSYHFIHSMALLFVSRAIQPQTNKLSRAGLLFSAGIILFSGSLYCVAISGDRSYG